MRRFDVRHFPCPSCGAEQAFEPEKGSLACEYCGHEEKIEAKSLPTGHPIEEGLAQAETIDEKPGEVSCPKCGASYPLPVRRAATRCPYCDTPSLRDWLNPILPDGVLPFRIAEKEAHRHFADWIGTLWFAPNELRHVVDARKKLTGFYLPHWIFDADTRTFYRGERGDAYYVTVERTRVVDGKEKLVQERERRIRWTPVSGDVARRFDDLSIPAEGSLPLSLLRDLEPWPLRDARAGMEERALCGFEVQEYDRPLTEGHREAREKMQQRIRLDVLRDIGGDEQRIHALDTRWSDERFKELLLPVWTTQFHYKGRDYYYVINGVTGTVAGERPYSYWKIGALIGIVVALSLIIYFWDQIRAAFGG